MEVTKTCRRLLDRIARGVGLRNQVAMANRGLVVHALHKSASMFLFKFFDHICCTEEIAFFSIHNEPADHNDIPVDMDKPFIVGPVRSFQVDGYDFPEMDRVDHLLHVRDPRDILVSEYFSLGWIHSDSNWSQDDLDRRATIQRLSLKEYVLKEPTLSKIPLLERYAPVLKMVDRHDVTIVRYEEMVRNFEGWLSPVLDLVQPNSRKRIEKSLLTRYADEFRPSAEDNGHKRNVMPGDHREKLDRETVGILNQRFGPILELLDYL